MLVPTLAAVARRVPVTWRHARAAASSSTRPPARPLPPTRPPPPPLALTIHYCAACGYAPWVAAAAAAARPTASVTGVPVSQTGAFEVFVVAPAGAGFSASGGLLAWSKMETGQPTGVEGVGAVVEAVLAEVRRKGRVVGV